MSNTQPYANHPLVQQAGIKSAVLRALVGNPQTVTIDPQTGEVTRLPAPLKPWQLGMGIALEAISGALTGLSKSGPNANAQGAAAAFQQGEQAQTARQQAQEQQAQNDANQRSQALLRQASLFHTAAETAAASSEAESRGLDDILKLAQINRESGILDVDSSLLDNNGQPMTQAELLQGMQSGKISIGDHLGPIAGAVEVQSPDGSKHYESTHLVIRDPESKVDLTPEMYKNYQDAGVPGFQSDNQSAIVQVPLRMIQSWNEQAASHWLATQRLSDLKATLAGTPEADKVPTSIDWSKPGVNAAMSRYRYYVSHDSENLSNPFLALQQMGASKRDPKTGAIQPNPDAKYVDTVAQVFGGWPLLQAANDAIATNKKDQEAFSIIDSPEKAQAVLAAPKRFTADQRSSAQNFLRIASIQGTQKASQEARARAIAEGKDVEAMLKTGINPITHERLTLDNAPDSMLVDANGNPVPQNQQSLYKPSGTERSTADTARQVLAISADLQAAINKNPAIIGPLAGRSKQLLAKAGVGDAEAQTLLDNISFLQTAATKMHTGRFSNEILNKMGELIKPAMNADQFRGALTSINAVAQRYAQEDRLITVGELKAMQSGTQQQLNSLSIPRQQTRQQPNGHIVPPGATIGRDSKGNVVGYRTADGKVVRF